MSALLEVEKLTVGYNDNIIVANASFSVEQGSVVALLGRNGAGKSTVMRGLAGVLMPIAGRIQFLNKDITGLPPRMLLKAGLSYVAQGRECFPDMTISENLDVASLSLDMSASERKESKKKALAFFPILRDLLEKPVHQLSGGQQQMLVVAMAFAQNPKCILLDEPSLGLGESIIEALLDGLKQFSASGGSILLVEQKPSIVFKIGDYAYYIENKKIAMEGHPQTLRDDPLFIERYLGVTFRGGVM